MVHLERKYHLSQISNWNVGIWNIRGCLLHYISQTTSNSVGRRPSPLTWPTFCATWCQGFMKLFKPSLHLILGLPRFLVCPWGVQKVNAGCPMVACSSRHMTSPIPFEFAYDFRAISFFGFFFESHFIDSRAGGPGGCEAPQTKSWVSRPPLNVLVRKKHFYVWITIPVTSATS